MEMTQQEKACQPHSSLHPLKELLMTLTNTAISNIDNNELEPISDEK